MKEENLLGRFMALELCIISLIRNIPSENRAGLAAEYMRISEGIFGNALASGQSDEFLQAFEKTRNGLMAAYTDQKLKL